MKCPKCNLPMLRETMTGGKCACDYDYGIDLYSQVAKAWQDRAEKAEAVNLENAKSFLNQQRELEKYLTAEKKLTSKLMDDKTEAIIAKDKAEEELARVKGITEEQIKDCFITYLTGDYGNIGNASKAIKSLIQGGKA